ncbi:hypothetical protein Tco_0619397 [Tanacetum coccineum]
MSTRGANQRALVLNVVAQGHFKMAIAQIEKNTTTGGFLYLRHLALAIIINSDCLDHIIMSTLPPGRIVGLNTIIGVLAKYTMAVMELAARNLRGSYTDKGFIDQFLTWGAPVLVAKRRKRWVFPAARDSIRSTYEFNVMSFGLTNAPAVVHDVRDRLGGIGASGTVTEDRPAGYLSIRSTVSHRYMYVLLKKLRSAGVLGREKFMQEDMKAVEVLAT